MTFILGRRGRRALSAPQQEEGPLQGDGVTLEDGTFVTTEDGSYVLLE
jgi:hypothetical protein